MDEIENQILEKLDILIRITAATVIQGKELKDQVRILSLVGLQPKDIADLLGKKPNHISVILAGIRKAKK